MTQPEHTLRPNRPECRYCDGPCVTWDELPTTDQGRGLCDWCGKAITQEWPAVKYPDSNDNVTHYHFCPFTPTTGHES